MAKNYDLFLERMKQKYNTPQTTAKPTNTFQYNRQPQNQYYNPAQPEEQPQQNVFQDGQLNLWEKVGAGVQQFRDTATSTFLGLGEGVIDMLAQPISAIAEWTGNTSVQKDVDEFIKKEWLSTLPQQDWYQKGMNVVGLDFMWGQDAKQAAMNKEALPEIVDQVASGIGSALGFAALSAVPVVGPGLAFAGSGGMGAQEALQQGATSSEALGYGAMSGALESALEFGVGKVLGAAGVGLGKVGGILGKTPTKTLAKEVGKGAAYKIVSRMGKNFVEEGLEELLSEVADPLLQKLSYKKDEELSDIWEDQISVENLIQTFLVGGITGGLFEGATSGIDILKSGGAKNWNIKQEAQNIQSINEEIKTQIAKRNVKKAEELYAKKQEAIEKVKAKFDEFYEQVKSNPNLKNLAIAGEYDTQKSKTKGDLFLETSRETFANQKDEVLNKLGFEYSKEENGVSKPSTYNAKDNTVYLNKEKINDLNTAFDELAHEVGHAIHTSGVDTNFINKVTQGFNDFDSLVVENYKGKVKNMDDLISYYENVKNYKEELLKNPELQKRMNEKKISKEQAYQEMRNEYMLEEIANDIFAKKYFTNLLELKASLIGKDPNFIRRIKQAVVKRFTNTKNKPSNYKEVMQIFKDGIDQNYDSFKEYLVKEGKYQRREDDRRKIATIKEEDLENITDSEGNKLTKEQIEYFKNSAVRDENGNLLAVYHGTTNDFTVFDKELSQNAFFFASNELAANSYYGYLPEQGKTLKVYLNLKNPKIIDVKNSWDKIDIGQTKKVNYTNYEGIKQAIKNIKNLDQLITISNTLTEYDLDNVPFETIISEELQKGKTKEQIFEELYDAEAMLEYLEEIDFDGRIYNIGQFNEFSNLTIKTKEEPDFSTTRDVVEQTLKEGKYDGIIFKNILDYNNLPTQWQKMDTVYVAFEPNQIKLTNNKKPTRRDDIRYKLDETTKETRNDKLKKVTEIKNIDENQKQILKDTVLRPVYISSDDVVSLENSNDFFNQKFVATTLDWLNFEKENNSSPRLINLSSGEVISISSLFTKENMKFTEIVDYLLTIAEIPQTRTDILNLVWNKSKKEKFNNIQNYFSEKLGYFNGVLQEVIWNRFDISSLNVSKFKSLENLLYQYAGARGFELSIQDIFMSNMPNNKDRFEYISEKTKTDLNNLLKNAGYDLQITNILEDGKKIEIKQDVWERTLNYNKFEDFLQQYINGNEQKTSNDVLNYVKTEFEKVKKRSKFKDRSNYDNLEYVLDNYSYTPEYNKFPFAMLTKKGNDIYLDFYADNKLDGYFWSTKIGEETEDEYKSKTRQIEINEIYLRFKEWDINESARRVIEEFYSSKAKNFYEEIRRYNSAKGFVLSQILNNENSTMDNNSGVLILKKEYYTPFMKKIFIDNLAFGLSDTTFSFGQLGYYGCFTPEENVLELNIQDGFGDVFEDTLEHERFHSFYHKNNYIDDENLRDLLLARNDYIDEIVTSMIINNEYLDLMEQTKVSYSKTRAWFNGEPNGEINWLKYIKEEVLAHVLGGSVTIKDDNLQIDARERLLEAFKKYIQINLDKLNISLKDSDEYVYSKGIYRLNGKISKPKRIVYLDINADYEKLGNDTIQGVSDYLTELETSDYETYDFEDYEEFDLEDYLNEDEFDENGVLISKYSNRNYKRYNLSEEIKTASEVRDKLESQKERYVKTNNESGFKTYIRLLKPEIKKAFDYLESKNGNLTYDESKEAQEFSQIVKDFGIEGFDFDKFPKVSAYDTLKEALKPKREKPEIDESKKIVVSKLKSTPKNAYNSFDKLLEKFGDVYSVFDYYSGEYHLKNWELSFLNEALYQNGRYDEQSKQDIIDYLKIGDLDPYLEYQRYLNGDVYPETTKQGKLELDDEQKSISKEVTYDFTELQTQEDFKKVYLDISRRMQNIYAGSTGVKVNNRFSLNALKNDILGETLTLEQKEEHMSLYKLRYNLLKGYSTRLKELLKVAKNQFPPKEYAKLEKEMKEQRTLKGYTTYEDTYKLLETPENIEKSYSQSEDVVNKIQEELNNKKNTFKKALKGLEKTYNFVNDEQKQQKEAIAKLINDLQYKYETYNDDVANIQNKLSNFEKALKDNKSRLLNVTTLKNSLKTTLQNIENSYNFVMDKDSIIAEKETITKQIESITYQNYEELKSDLEKKVKEFREKLENISKQANKFIVNKGLFTIAGEKLVGRESKIEFSLSSEKASILEEYENIKEKLKTSNITQSIKLLKEGLEKLTSQLDNYKSYIGLDSENINEQNLIKKINSVSQAQIEGETKVDVFKSFLHKKLEEIADVENLENKLQELTDIYNEKKEIRNKIIAEEKAKPKEEVKQEPKVETKIEQKEETKQEQIKTEEPATEKEQIIKIIKDTRYLHRESAKSVKSEADINEMKKFSKEVSVNLIKVVRNKLTLIAAKTNVAVRLNFEGGQDLAIDDMFEAFNTLSSDEVKLKQTILDIFLRGLEVATPAYEVKNGKIYLKGRETYSKVKTNQTEVGNMILKELNYLIDNAIKTEGKDTLLAKNIVEHTVELVKLIQEQQETIAKLMQEHNFDVEEISKQTEVKSEKDVKDFDSKLNKINKRIDKLENDLKKVSENKAKLKEKINDLRTEAKDLKKKVSESAKKLDETTMKKIEAETNLFGVYSFDGADVKYINRIIKKFFGEKEKIDSKTRDRISALYNVGNFDGVVDEIMEFITNKKVPREVYIYNEETMKMEATIEKADFKDVYAPNVIETLKQQIKEDILGRILRGRDVYSKLPKAYNEIKKLRNKIKTDKETSKKLKSISSLITKISNLANNKKRSALANKIDTRFKTISNELGGFSKAKMLKGEFREKLKELKSFLTEEKFDKKTFQEYSGLNFPTELFEELDKLENIQGQVSIEELELYEKILDVLHKFIEEGTGKRMLKLEDGSEISVEDYVKEALGEQTEIMSKISKEEFGKIMQMVDPRVVFRVLSGFKENSKLFRLFEELQKGDTMAMAKEMELKKDLEDFYKKHKKFKKSLSKKTTINGIETTVGNFISIYKLIRREEAYKHIVNNGIDIDGKLYKFESAEKLVEFKKAIAETLELRKEGSLNKEFFDKTVKFFKDAGEAKQIVDKKLYGYSNVKLVDERGHEVEYFPIHISSVEFNRKLGETQYNSRMSASFNYSWNNSITGSGGALKITNVQDIIDVHSRQVAQYFGLAEPLALFNQIYSFQIQDGENVVSLRKVLNTRFGQTKEGKYAVEDYLKVLFDDIRGANAYAGEVDGFFRKMFSKFRKRYSTYVLGANLKVAGVQFAAIPASYKYVSLKNMRKAMLKKVDFDKYKLPDLGKYRTYDKSILKSETLTDDIGKVADAFGKLMSFTDNLTIKFAWKAALFQTANENGTFNEAEATKLFEKIVRETQPQYSAIERSALLRSKNDLVKLLTQFQSQANKNFSTIIETAYKSKYYRKQGNKMTKEEKLASHKAVVSIATQTVMTVALTYLIKGLLLGDLDDDELSVKGIIENLFNDGLGIVPLMNNIKLDLQKEGKLGYIDIYEMNLGSISKLYDAVTKLGRITDEDKDWKNKTYNAVDFVGVFTGIPTGNIYKYSMAILKKALPNKAILWDSQTKGVTFLTKSEVNEQLSKKNYTIAKQYYNEYTKTILDLDEKTKDVLFELYKEGYTNVYIKQVPKTIMFENEEISIDKEKFMKTYSKLTPALKTLISNPTFNSLDKDSQAKAISKLINTYYNLAKKEFTEEDDYSDIEVLVKFLPNFNAKTFAYLSYIDTISSNEKNSKKELVQKYINSLKLSSGEKLLLYVLSGYSIPDKNLKTLKSFLSSRGMQTKYINYMLN